MARAGRVGDKAQRSHHEPGAGGQAGDGEAIQGSPDVLIDGRAALRVGDPGEPGPPGGPSWRASRGSTGVFINGKPAYRHGDEATHEGGTSELVEGSPHVFFGDARRGAPDERPHDRAVTIDVTDGLGRPVHDVRVEVFCPHKDHDGREVDGSPTIGGPCSGATVTVHKPLQTGEQDPGASQVGGHHDLSTKHTKTSGNGNGTGGAVYVNAPAPTTTTGDHHAVPIVHPDGAVGVKLPTVHNWVELVYRAFGHHVPLSAKQLALLGLREASLAPEADDLALDDLERMADAGNLDEVRFTREKRAPTYDDLLFCVWTDSTVHKRQHVEVFECTIDAGPGKGPLHLPFLLEGKVFHATPGGFDKHHPGKDITLHVFPGKHEVQPKKGVTAHDVIAMAKTQKNYVEGANNDNKFGIWYHMNNQSWCAMFVSWCFWKAGMDEIRYSFCNDAVAAFKDGRWGTWHGADAHAEPGDIVIYNWDGDWKDDHTGIVIEDHGSTMTTIEGNTSPSSSGSQSNGDGVYIKSRTKFGVVGFGRPRYHKPVEVERSFIRWGGEGLAVNLKSDHGSTVLRHHYFKKDHHGHVVPDPKAQRYQRFMQVYKHSANKAQIPYLIVSSRYVKTYGEWIAWVNAHPGVTPGPRSVIREDGLAAPQGHAHHYLPSFLGKVRADQVLQKIHHMHDRHAAAKLRQALEGCLFELSI